MSKLTTISDDVAARLRDSLYFTVRMNLVDRKVRDQWVLDQRARDIIDKLIADLDGLDIRLPTTRRPMHSDRDFYPPEEMTVAEHVSRTYNGRPDLMPIMNVAPEKVANPSNKPIS
jgi:hypothetical protein